MNFVATENFYLDTTNNPMLKDMFGLTISFKPLMNASVKYSRRKRLHFVILEILSMCTTLLVKNVGALAHFFDFEYGKVNIFKKIFYINSFDEEDNFKEIRKIKNDFEDRDNDIDNKYDNYDKNIELEGKSLEKNEINSKENNNKKDKNNFDNYLVNSKENLKDLNYKEEEKKIKENKDFIMNHNKIRGEISNKKQNDFNRKITFLNNQNSQKNQNDLKQIKNIELNNNQIRIKIEEIKKKYPSISNKKNYLKDERLVSDICEEFIIFLKCGCKKIRNINRLSKIIDQEFAKSMNIFNFIRRTKKLEILENILFDEDNEKKLLNFISLPILDVNKENKMKKPLLKFDDIFDTYIDTQNKENKTDIERKLISSLKEKLNENL